MTLSRLREPWAISDLLLNDAQSRGVALDARVFMTCPAFDTSRNAQDTTQPVTQVLDRFYARPEGYDGPWHVYALLDAQRSMFLQDRLQTTGLDYCCLYDIHSDDSIGDVAPWLVALPQDNAFTKATFAHDTDDTDPRRMLDQGIWLASPLSLDEMRQHLRKLTILKDECEVAQYFRLQEPAMLHALMVAAPDAARRVIFSGIALMLYPRPALKAQLWDFVMVQYGEADASTMSPVRQSEPHKAARVDSSARLSLKVFAYEKRAVHLAVTHIDVEQRPAAVRVFLRLMLAGFDYPERLRDAFDLLQKLPDDAFHSFWAHVESGDYSLGYVIVHFSKHYDLPIVQNGAHLSR